MGREKLHSIISCTWLNAALEDPTICVIVTNPPIECLFNCFVVKMQIIASALPLAIHLAFLILEVRVLCKIF